MDKHLPSYGIPLVIRTGLIIDGFDYTIEDADYTIKGADYTIEAFDYSIPLLPMIDSPAPDWVSDYACTDMLREHRSITSIR